MPRRSPGLDRAASCGAAARGIPGVFIAEKRERPALFYRENDMNAMHDYADRVRRAREDLDEVEMLFACAALRNLPASALRAMNRQAARIQGYIDAAFENQEAGQ